tara:strand:+ start:829 stop:1017 length:189 start_codon:yes stop_codon:yes gene_type:complete
MEKKVVYEVKLQTSVIIILGIMAVGILGLVFKEAIAPAWALDNYDNITVDVRTPGYFDVRIH